MRIGAGEITCIGMRGILQILHPFLALATCPTLEHNVPTVRKHLQTLAHASLIDARRYIESLIEEYHSTYAAICGSHITKAGLLHKEPTSTPSATDHIRAEVIATHTTIALETAEEIATSLTGTRRSSALEYDTLFALDAQARDKRDVGHLHKVELQR